MGAIDRELDRLGNRRRQELRRRHRDERDEVHTVGVAFDPARGGLERESGLARPARPDEREQAAVGILEQPVDLVELGRAANERRAWGRQVPHARLDRLQKREVAQEPFDVELVDALRRAEILEAVHAQVADVRVHERPGRLRQEHLPAVPDSGYTRALMDVEADVSLVGQPRLARVQPHPHPYRPVGKCTLAVRGGGDRVRRAGESDEERVALRVDLDALVVGKHGAESPPMLVQRLPVGVAELVQQPRRALHVGEQQCHDTGRQIAHHRRRSCADAALLSSRRAPRSLVGSQHFLNGYGTHRWRPTTLTAAWMAPKRPRKAISGDHRRSTATRADQWFPKPRAHVRFMPGACHLTGPDPPLSRRF